MGVLRDKDCVFGCSCLYTFSTEVWNDYLAVRPNKSQFHSVVHMWSHLFLDRPRHFHSTGHRRFRLSSKKNAEKYSQRASTLLVSILLSDAISVFKVSLPIDLLLFNIYLPPRAHADIIFIAEGGGTVCNCQKFHTGRISCVY